MFRKEKKIRQLYAEHLRTPADGDADEVLINLIWDTGRSI